MARRSETLELLFAFMIFFLLFFFFFAFFNAKLINHIILSRNVFFRSFLVELGDFNFDMGLRKKRRKVVVHHTPTKGSSVVVAVSVPLPYGLRPYGVDRPPLSWLCLNYKRGS